MQMYNISLFLSQLSVVSKTGRVKIISHIRAAKNAERKMSLFTFCFPFVRSVALCEKSGEKIFSPMIEPLISRDETLIFKIDNSFSAFRYRNAEKTHTCPGVVIDKA